jgi:DNA-directed RNA polymerase specialized sigma24 family protein
VIIRNAIKMLAPVPGQSDASATTPVPQSAGSERDALMSVVWELPPFERFVFVISVLEGHSVSDSASLLGCTVTDLTRARSQALSSVTKARSAGGYLPRIRKSATINFFATPKLA